MTTAPAVATVRDLPLQTRIVPVATVNAEARTFETVWTTGARVKRFDWESWTPYWEELSLDPAHIRMGRFEAGAPVLNSHRTADLSAVLGVTERAWMTPGEGRSLCRFSDRDETVNGYWRDVVSGIIRNVSVGYIVHRYMKVDATEQGGIPTWVAIDWEPAEQSLVAVGADSGAGVRGMAGDGLPTEPTATLRAQLQAEVLQAVGGRTFACRIDQGIAQQQRGQSETEAPAARAIWAAFKAAQAADTPITAHTLAAPAPRAAAPISATRNLAMSETAAMQAAADTTTAPAAAQPATETRAADNAASAAAEIADLCVRHGVPQLAAGMIRAGQTLEQARAAVQQELAVRDAAAGGHRNVASGVVQTVRDEFATRIAGVEQAIMHRIAPKTVLDDNGRAFRGMSLLEIGRIFLESHGQQTRGLDRVTLAGRILQFRAPGMHATGDFSSLFANVANKRLRGAYDENPGSYTVWARRAPNAPDFKSINVVQLSGAPSLLQTNEHGEFKYGTMTDSGESYNVITYGRIVSLTRQAIVNDDLRAFDRLVTAYGFASRRLENRLVYAQLTSNPTMGDTGALFNATPLTSAGGHANLGSGGGSALQFSSLTTGRAAMRLQKGLAGEELNISPAFLIVPATLEQTAYQLTSAAYVPATKAEISEFRAGGRTPLEPVVEPLLDATSTAGWYLASNSSQVDTVEYCYLDGAEGPVIESEMGFDIDGVSFKCRLDFAAKVVDFRGLYKGAGS